MFKQYAYEIENLCSEMWKNCDILTTLIVTHVDRFVPRGPRYTVLRYSFLHLLYY